MKAKQIMLVLLSLILIISSTFSVYGKEKKIEEEEEEPKEKILTEEEQREAANLIDKLSKVEERKQKAYDRLEEARKAAEAKQEEVDTLEKDIKQKEDRIVLVKKKTEKNQRMIRERKEGLDKRVRAMYTHGFTSYIDVMLSSKNIAEFVDNVDMLSRIYKYDREVLTKLVERKFQLQAYAAQMRHDQKRIVVQKEAFKEKSLELDGLKAEFEKGYKKVQEEEQALTDEIIAITERDYIEVDGKIINLYKKYKGGKMLCPVQGYVITGKYMEQRSYEKHPGIDLACKIGTPVRAAADGIVIKSDWYGGYGKCVVISHGGGLTTLYGHNSSLKCKEGDKVERGDVIALVGSTGFSTGPHCHFEIRMNGKTRDPGKYANIV